MFITQLPGSEVLPQKRNDYGPLYGTEEQKAIKYGEDKGYDLAVSSLENVDLVWDEEKIAREIFEACTYPSPDKWEDEPEEDKRVWRYRASIISDNAHLFLSLRRSE